MGCPLSSQKNQPDAFLLEKVRFHRAGINCMSLSDDGSLLVTGSDDCTAIMWSTHTKPLECLSVLEGHAGFVSCCLILKRVIVTGSVDGTLRKWSIGTGHCLFVYVGHESRINRVIYTGSFLVSTSFDKTARVWNCDVVHGGDDACIRVFQGHTKGTYPVLFVPCSENRKRGNGIFPNDRVVTGSADCTARSWSLDSGKCIQVFKNHEGSVNALVVEEEKQVLFTASSDGSIRTWNLNTGTALKELRGHSGPIYTLLMQNRMLYSASSDRTARAWVMEFGESTRVYKNHKLTVSCLGYLNGYLYTGSSDTCARMFEAKSGALKRTFRGHENVITCVQVIKGKLFTGSYDGSMRVWDTTGVSDDTVFGVPASDIDRNHKTEERESDSDDVTKAVTFLDPYIHSR